MKIKIQGLCIYEVDKVGEWYSVILRNDTGDLQFWIKGGILKEYWNEQLIEKLMENQGHMVAAEVSMRQGKGNNYYVSLVDVELCKVKSLVEEGLL